MRLDAPKCKRAVCRRHVRWNPDKGCWRLFCSRACVGKHRHESGHLATIRNVRHARMYARMIRRVVGLDYQDGDPVSLKQLIAIARAARHEGWQARNMRDVTQMRRAG